jgi:hypothetical protein
VVTAQALSWTEALRFDPFDLVCHSNNCRERERGIRQYADPRHVSVSVAESLISEFEALLSSV